MENQAPFPTMFCTNRRIVEYGVRQNFQHVDSAIETVAKTPLIGERKKGDLANLLVFKFRSQGQLYLLGYSLDQAVRLGTSDGLSSL